MQLWQLTLSGFSLQFAEIWFLFINLQRTNIEETLYGNTIKPNKTKSYKQKPAARHTPTHQPQQQQQQQQEVSKWRGVKMSTISWKWCNLQSHGFCLALVNNSESDRQDECRTNEVWTLGHSCLWHCEYWMAVIYSSDDVNAINVVGELSWFPCTDNENKQLQQKSKVMK